MSNLTNNTNDINTKNINIINILENFEITKSSWIARANCFRQNAEIVEDLINNHNQIRTIGLIDSISIIRLKEVLSIWNLLAVTVDIFIVSREETLCGVPTAVDDHEKLNSDGKRIIGLFQSFTNSSIGRPLVMRLLKYMMNKTSILGFHLHRQTLATMLCIFGQKLFNSLVLSGSSTTMTTPTTTETMSLTTDEFPFPYKSPSMTLFHSPMDDDFNHDISKNYIYFSRLLHFYSELLYRWELPIHAAQVRKNFQLPGGFYFNQDNIIDYNVNIEATCQKCCNIINENKNSSNQRLWCSSCHSHGINCSLCEEPIRGMIMFITLTDLFFIISI